MLKSRHCQSFYPKMVYKDKTIGKILQILKLPSSFIYSEKVGNACKLCLSYQISFSFILPKNRMKCDQELAIQQHYV